MELNIELERSELAILVLHMNVMRKPIKKGFKSNYGHFEGRKMIKKYDEVKERFENELKEESHLESEVLPFVLIDDEINMLSSFLTWYVEEIQKSAKQQGAKTNEDEQVMILVEVNQKLNSSIELIMEEVS
jgi:hypothetical protein